MRGEGREGEEGWGGGEGGEGRNHIKIKLRKGGKKKHHSNSRFRNFRLCIVTRTEVPKSWELIALGKPRTLGFFPLWDNISADVTLMAWPAGEADKTSRMETSVEPVVGAKRRTAGFRFRDCFKTPRG